MVEMRCIIAAFRVSRASTSLWRSAASGEISARRARNRLWPVGTDFTHSISRSYRQVDNVNGKALELRMNGGMRIVVTATPSSSSLDFERLADQRFQTIGIWRSAPSGRRCPASTLTRARVLRQRQWLFDASCQEDDMHHPAIYPIWSSRVRAASKSGRRECLWAEPMPSLQPESPRAVLKSDRH